MDASIYCLFPKVVYLKNIDYIDNKYLLSLNKFCKKLKYFKIPKEDSENVSQSSEDRYLFNDHKELFKLKDIIVKEFNNFKNNLLSYTYNSFKITTSWVAKVDKGKQANIHNHNNSFYSGVFYINSNDKFDKIKFFNDTYKTIKIEIKDWNLWNSESWWFSVKTGDVILFPSSLTHMVETKQGDNTRISLAFNVFIKGTIGNNKSLTELVF
jgi:uncharacterized protein (TIGR02466 family)